MSFAWEEFHTLGRELLQEEGAASCEEARQRTAIGRAYYATFLTARDAIDRKWYGTRQIRLPGGRKDHQAVIDELDRLPEPGPKTARKLELMRTDRNGADYDNPFDGTLDKRATEDVNRATRAIRDIGTVATMLTEQPPRTA